MIFVIVHIGNIITHVSLKYSDAYMSESKYLPSAIKDTQPSLSSEPKFGTPLILSKSYYSSPYY